MKQIIVQGYDTDKNQMPHYLRNYENFFSELVDKNIVLFELGVLRGGSMLMWRDYFLNGSIVGLDINNVDINDPTGRTRFYQGSQTDIELLNKIAAENAPDGFDIIIDDASHLGKLTRTSFWHLFDHHLKSGGIYVIEDWGTGYWDSWPDGKCYEKPLSEEKRIVSHDYGMVGFIKELIDECGMGDITHEKFGIPSHRESKIKLMQVSPGICFVVKK